MRQLTLPYQVARAQTEGRSPMTTRRFRCSPMVRAQYGHLLDHPT